MKPKILIKFVRKAHQWCKTIITFDERTGKKVQKQEWSSEKPTI